MKKDRLYFLTFISLSIIFCLAAIVTTQYFIKQSTEQLLTVQIESSKREALTIANLLDSQLEKDSKIDVINKLQQSILNTQTNAWFISVFNWSGVYVSHPNKPIIGEKVNNNKGLLDALKDANYSNLLLDVAKTTTSKSDEIIFISPLKNADLIVAAHVNINLLANQIAALKNKFYLLFLLMGIVVVVLSFVAVRFLGSLYEKQLEAKHANLTDELLNLSKLNADLMQYQENVTTVDIDETKTDNANYRILTYIRNELVPLQIQQISHIYTENAITYFVTFDDKVSTNNNSLDEVYQKLDAAKFFRANRQFIINIASINKIIKYGNNQLKIVLKNKTTVDIIISKNKAAEFKQWLNM